MSVPHYNNMEYNTAKMYSTSIPEPFPEKTVPRFILIPRVYRLPRTGFTSHGSNNPHHLFQFIHLCRSSLALRSTARAGVVRAGAPPRDNLVLSQVEFQAEAQLRSWVGADLVCEITDLRGKRGIDDVVWIGLQVSCESCREPVLEARLAEYVSTIRQAGYRE